MHATLRDTSPLEVESIKGGATLPLDSVALNLKANDNRTAYLTFLTSAYRLVQASGGARMLAAAYDIPLHGIAAENWNRAIIVLRHAMRESRDDRAKNKATSRAVTAAKDAAVLPQFLSDDDFSTMVEGAPLAGSSAAANADTAPQDPLFAQRDRLEAAFAADFGEEGQPGRLDLSSDKAGADIDAADSTLVAAFSSLPSGANSAFSRKARSSRVRMTKAEVLKFTQGLQKSVKVNWGPQQIDAMRQTLALSVDELSDITTTAMLSCGGDAGDNDDGGDEPPSDEDATPVEVAYRAIRAAMNDSGAPLPPYLESCKWAGVEPASLTFAIKGSKSSEMATLKPWQPQSESPPLLRSRDHKPC